VKALSKSKLVKVEARSLRIHPIAQREVVPSKLKKLIAELDLDAIGVLHAVEYEIPGHGHGIWIIDGQHRWRALMHHGFGEWVVEVKIHLDVTDDARASELFLKLNDRAVVSPYDKFQNEVSAGYPAAVKIVDILHRRGLKVARTIGDGNVCCVTALKNLFRTNNDGKTLELALDSIIAAWGTRAAALEGKLIEGIGLVYSAYNGSIDQAGMAKKLAKYPGGPSALLGDAKGLMPIHKATLSHCVADIVIARYNSGRKTGRIDPL
jgi:hypothetical protein